MPPKGKPATKGQKQIVEENKDALKFYSVVIASVNVVFFGVTYIFFWESFTSLYILLAMLCGSIYAGSYKVMQSMAKPTYDPTTGALLDGGIDLNMESGMAEHMKDLVLLTAGTQVLTLLSSLFWLLLLLAPGRAFYMLWVNVLGPWFFAEPPEVDEKKQKKMERKINRRR